MRHYVSAFLTAAALSSAFALAQGTPAAGRSNPLAPT